MTGTIYRYRFDESVEIADVEAAMVAALVAVESLHGESRARLDAVHDLDREQRVCLVDARTAAGRDLSLLFTGTLRRRIGESHFTVRRVDAAAANQNPASHTNSCRRDDGRRV